MAIDAAMDAVSKIQVKSVPPHLQDAHYSGASQMGRGLGYKYAHSYPGHYVPQQYLPDELVGAKFFEPGNNGYEQRIRQYMDYCKKRDDEET